MYITVKGLTYGKYAGGGDGASNLSPYYTGGKQKENLTVRADINFEYAEGQDYADGVRIANKRKMTGVTTAFELADLPEDIKKDLLNWVVSDAQNNLEITDKTPQYFGIGFYIWNEEPLSEDDNYIAYWIYKSRFSADSISVATSNDSISYQHQTINGRGVGVKANANDKHFSFVKTNGTPFSMEEQAVEWLRARAGMATEGIVDNEGPAEDDDGPAAVEDPDSGG